MADGRSHLQLCATDDHGCEILPGLLQSAALLLLLIIASLHDVLVEALLLLTQGLERAVSERQRARQQTGKEGQRSWP